MIRVCAWCKTILGYKEPYDDHDITHSICLPCNEEYFPELYEDEKEINKEEKEND